MSETVKKKKKFGIPSALSKGLANTMSMAEHHVIDFKNSVIPMSYIETDPKNPRRMKLSLEEITTGLHDNTPHYSEKSKELDALQELAWSIQKKGLINPITVYQRGEKYRLVAGERRYLASIMAKKTEIEARIYKNIPSEEDLKLVQWIENTARADLRLADKIANIESIFNFYKEKSAQNLDVDILMQLTGLAKTNAYRYLSILNHAEIRACIENGDVDSLRAAATLSEIKDPVKLAAAMAVYKEGGPLNDIVQQIKSNNTYQPRTLTSSVSLGKVSQGRVVKILIDALVQQPSYHHLQPVFTSIDWENTKEVATSFKKLLSILEREI